VCGIYELCTEDAKSSAATERRVSVAEEELTGPEKGPLSFEWSAASPITSDEFDWFLDSLIQSFNESPASVVQITGLYDPQEVNHSEFENLGLARAENI
jgi:hypothetical protein